MFRERFNLIDVMIYAILIIFCATIVLPFWHLLSISFSPSHVATRGGLVLWPQEFTVDNYERVLTSRWIWTGYKNTIIRTVIGVFTQLTVTSLGAYALSKKFFPHRTFWTFLIVFTMFFSGGLIPTYLLVRDLGLLNSYSAMILPGLVSAFNLVIMRNFFMAVPEEIEESCLIDGAGRWRTFFSIVLPLSKPVLATVGLWLAVGHWNAWFDVLIYITDDAKFTLPIILRRIIITGTQQMFDMTMGTITAQDSVASPEGMRAAAIFVATVPILCVYPFIQKYFVQGIMLGSLKG
jgi:putative aldouronate transport system permease protein